MEVSPIPGVPVTMFVKHSLRSLKRILRGYVTVSGREARAQQRMVTNRSDARKILMDFAGQGGIGEVLVRREGSIISLKDGRSYWWDPDDNVLRMFTVSIRGDFEEKETRFLRSVLRPGDTVLDVGASFGWYTLVFSQMVGDAGRVHAFEPIPHNFDILARNCRLNQAANVRLNNIAIGAKVEDRDLYLPDIGSSGAFRLHQYRNKFETIHCRAQTLDDYVARSGISHVDLIKADIEGAELEMLHGATNVLQIDSQPIWLIEIQAKSCSLFGHTPRAVFDRMCRFGYSPYCISEAGILQPLLDTSEPLPDYNFVFAKDNRLAELGYSEENR
jgi:FkbM family methyltransferase